MATSVDSQAPVCGEIRARISQAAGCAPRPAPGAQLERAALDRPGPASWSAPGSTGRWRSTGPARGAGLDQPLALDRSGPRCRVLPAAGAGPARLAAPG